MPEQRGQTGSRGAMGGPGGPGGPGGVSYGNGGLNGDRNVILVAMGALSVLGTVVWWAITTRMDDLKHTIEVDRKEIHDSLQNLKADSTSTYLTKDAYVGQHNALIDQVNRLQDRHNELRTDVSRIITPGDSIKEILDRLKILESKIYSVQGPKKASE